MCLALREDVCTKVLTIPEVKSTLYHLEVLTIQTQCQQLEKLVLNPCELVTATQLHDLFKLI